MNPVMFDGVKRRGEEPGDGGQTEGEGDGFGLRVTRQRAYIMKRNVNCHDIG